MSDIIDIPLLLIAASHHNIGIFIKMPSDARSRQDATWSCQISLSRFLETGGELWESPKGTCQQTRTGFLWKYFKFNVFFHINRLTNTFITLFVVNFVVTIALWEKWILFYQLDLEYFLRRPLSKKVGFMECDHPWKYL